jgi:hypothetical protein
MKILQTKTISKDTIIDMMNSSSKNTTQNFGTVFEDKDNVEYLSKNMAFMMLPLKSMQA